jgi:hypothetical protein
MSLLSFNKEEYNLNTFYSGMDLRPFLSYFQTGQHQFIPPHVSFPAPWLPTCNKSVPAPSTDPVTQHVLPRKKSKSAINIDDNDDVRTAKRLVWEQDEDLRLVSIIIILSLTY